MQPSNMTTEDTVATPLLPGDDVTLTEVDLYSECNTTIEQECTVSALLGACDTDDVMISNNQVSCKMSALLIH